MTRTASSAYIAKHKDLRPIYYLIAKFLGEQDASRDHALAQVAEALQSLPQLLATAGFPTTPQRRGGRA